LSLKNKGYLHIQNIPTDLAIFYVLPRQLFPMTLGCDWFKDVQAQLWFDINQFVLLDCRPIPICTPYQQHIARANTWMQVEIIDNRQKSISNVLQQFPRIFQQS
jgi:hypothetical protein